MIQLLLGCIILGIGFFIFYVFPIHKDSRNLVLGALFAIIALVLKRFSLMLPLFAVPAIKISFESLALFIAGVILPPSYAYIVALVVDLIGLIITPTQFPFLGFTLSTVLSTSLPSVMYTSMKQWGEKKLQTCLWALCIISISLTSMYVLTLHTVKINSLMITMNIWSKVIIISFCIFLALMLGFVILHMKRKRVSLPLFYTWVCIVIVSQLTISFLLNPYWLQVMYGIPYSLSLFVRVIKECIMIPLTIIIGYQIIKVLKR